MPSPNHTMNTSTDPGRLFVAGRCFSLPMAAPHRFASLGSSEVGRGHGSKESIDRTGRASNRSSRIEPPKSGVWGTGSREVHEAGIRMPDSCQSPYNLVARLSKEAMQPKETSLILEMCAKPSHTSMVKSSYKSICCVPSQGRP